jgi:hypothetical protein
MWRKARGVVVVAGALSVAGTLLVNALFTDTASVPNNTFASGTVDIATTPNGTVAIAYNAMAPGDVVTAPITVTNSGTLDLRYAVTSTTNPSGLDADLKMWIRTGGTDTACTAATTWAGFAGWGTAGAAGDVYGTAAAGSADASGAVVGSSTGTNIIGNPSAGAHAGDRVLPPTTGNSEVLCVRVLLPVTASGVGPTGGSQGKTTTTTFLFSAEQTKNN